MALRTTLETVEDWYSWRVVGAVRGL